MSEHTFTGSPMWTYSSGTMDLRDWFAGMCQPYVEEMSDDDLVSLVQALLGDSGITKIEATGGRAARLACRKRLEAKAIAALCYMQADAMLAERERSKDDAT